MVNSSNQINETQNETSFQRYSSFECIVWLTTGGSDKLVSAADSRSWANVTSRQSELTNAKNSRKRRPGRCLCHYSKLIFLDYISLKMACHLVKETCCCWRGE